MQIDKTSQTSFKAVVIPQGARQSVKEYLMKTDDYDLLDIINKACDEFAKQSDINICLENGCIPVLEAFGKRFGEYFHFANNKSDSMTFLTKCFDKSSSDYGKEITVDLSDCVKDVYTAHQKIRNVKHSTTGNGTAIKRCIELARILSENKKVSLIDFWNPTEEINKIFAKAKM